MWYQCVLAPLAALHGFRSLMDCLHAEGYNVLWESPVQSRVRGATGFLTWAMVHESVASNVPASLDAHVCVTWSSILFFRDVGSRPRLGSLQRHV